MTTQPLPVVRPARRRRRWPVVLLVVLLVVAGLVVAAYIVGERIFRDRAEAQIEQTVAASLPDGVTGRVDAEILGSSSLQQYLGGSFDHVVLRSSGLRVAGAPATAVVQLRGLPVDGGRVQEATARLRVSQAAFRDLPALQDVDATDPVIGDGTVSTTLKQSILGLQVVVGVTLTPSLRGQVVHLTPTAASLTAGPATVPAIAIVRQLLPDGVSVCAATYLPRGIELTGLTAERGAVEATVVGRDLDLAALDSGRTGTCD